MISPISFFSKNKFLDQSHKLYFIFLLKNSSFGKFSAFFFFLLLLSLSFLLFLFSLFFFSSPRWSLYHAQRRELAAGPSLPHAPPTQPCPPPLWLPFPLPSSPPSPHGHLPWRALTKVIFLCEMIKLDAHDLPLSISTHNFIRN
jgi:hypothetical protein